MSVNRDGRHEAQRKKTKKMSGGKIRDRIRGEEIVVSKQRNPPGSDPQDKDLKE